MGLCNLNGQHRRFGWTYCFHHRMACVDRRKMILQNIHNHVCTTLYDVLTQTTLWILSTVSTSNPVPKVIKKWNIDGNVTLEKLNYRRLVQWSLDSRMVWRSNNLKLEQKIRFETRIKILKSNHERGIAQHRAAHATLSHQIRTWLVECCWSVCASVHPVPPVISIEKVSICVV